MLFTFSNSLIFGHQSTAVALNSFPDPVIALHCKLIFDDYRSDRVCADRVCATARRTDAASDAEYQPRKRRAKAPANSANRQRDALMGDRLVHRTNCCSVCSARCDLSTSSRSGASAGGAHTAQYSVTGAVPARVMVRERARRQQQQRWQSRQARGWQERAEAGRRACGDFET